MGKPKAKEKDPAAVSLGRRGGKIGGKATSPAKTKAARENAKLGGRPRATSPEEELRPGPLWDIVAALGTLSPDVRGLVLAEIPEEWRERIVRYIRVTTAAKMAGG